MLSAKVILFHCFFVHLKKKIVLENFEFLNYRYAQDITDYELEKLWDFMCSCMTFQETRRSFSLSLERWSTSGQDPKTVSSSSPVTNKMHKTNPTQV